LFPRGTCAFVDDGGRFWDDVDIDRRFWDDVDIDIDNDNRQTR
jgi:hypothetical protein